MIQAAVLTISDSVHRGSRLDLSGPAVRERLEQLGWSIAATEVLPDEADAIAEETQTLAARDPLHQGASKRPQAYYRMPGPAGYKSRYEDPAIERLAAIAREADHAEATYVFANVDTFADAKRFKKQLGL